MLEAKTVEAPIIASRPSLIKPAGADQKPLSTLVVDGLVTITPELARRIILECGYERQRSVRPLHASALAMQMRRKEWTPGTQVHFARMTADGWLRLLDGQHRLHAVIEANTAVEFQILVSPCKNETEAARLYRRHDRLSVQRTIDDVLKAEGIPAKHEITNFIARGVFKAALIIASDFAFTGRMAKADPYTYRSDEARLRLCEPWWPIVELFADSIRDGEFRIKKIVSAGGPMAVALVTLRDQEAKADAFWRGLVNNDGLLKNDPRAAYVRFLSFGKGRLGAFASAKAASIAWNAFYAGKKLDYIRMVDTPIRIAGTAMA